MLCLTGTTLRAKRRRNWCRLNLGVSRRAPVWRQSRAVLRLPSFSHSCCSRLGSSRSVIYEDPWYVHLLTLILLIQHFSVLQYLVW